MLDHKRPDQPTTSPAPERKAVGRSHQRREWSSWRACSTVQPHDLVGAKWDEGKGGDVRVERLKSTTKMMQTLLVGM